MMQVIKLIEYDGYQYPEIAVDQNHLAWVDKIRATDAGNFMERGSGLGNTQRKDLDLTYGLLAEAAFSYLVTGYEIRAAKKHLERYGSHATGTYELRKLQRVVHDNITWLTITFPGEDHRNIRTIGDFLFNGWAIDVKAIRGFTQLDPRTWKINTLRNPLLTLKGTPHEHDLYYYMYVRYDRRRKLPVSVTPLGGVWIREYPIADSLWIHPGDEVNGTRYTDYYYRTSISQLRPWLPQTSPQTSLRQELIINKGPYGKFQSDLSKGN